MEIICDQCGKSFEGRKPAKRCSHECRKAARRASQRAYQATKKGRATKRAYNKTYNKYYRESERGKAYLRAYSKSERCKKAWKDYNKSKKGKAARKAYKLRLKLSNSKISNTSLAAWSLQVRERDEHVCQHCSFEGPEGLHAHHILGKAKYPQLALDLDNGITLCEECHQAEHRDYPKRFK